MKPEFSPSEPRFDPAQLARLLGEIDRCDDSDWALLLELFRYEAWRTAIAFRQ